MRLPAIAFCLAGIPSLMLAVLAMVGRADVWPALLGAVLGLAATVVFVLLWRQDLDRLAEAVRRMAPTARCRCRPPTT
jgi:two-component system phosphate regulon sensor histidine kinase PhoR